MIRVLLVAFTLITTARAAGGPGGLEPFDFHSELEYPENIRLAREHFERVLQRLHESRDAKYSQHSAAIYAAIEESEPDLFKRIGQSVASGRWRLSDGRIVLPDENLISAESQIRQLLYGQRYFQERFHKIATTQSTTRPLAAGSLTTHGDIKRWNRDAESILESAETVAALASQMGFDYPGKEFRASWEAIAQNQQHDIIGGACIPATYNRAEAMSARVIESGRSIRERALQFIASQVKGEGPGIVVFNPTGSPAGAVIDFPAEWMKDAGEFASSGDDPAVPIQHVGGTRAAFFARSLPPFGYRRYRFTREVLPTTRPTAVVSPDGTRLENADYRVTVDPARGVVTSIFDKSRKVETLATGGSGNRLEIHWESGKAMTAAVIGDIERVESLDSPVQLRITETGPARVAVSFDRAFQSSTLHQTISLSAAGPPEFSLATEWKEVGDRDKTNPFLKVAFDVDTQNPRLTCQGAIGAVESPIDNRDHAMQKFADLSGPLGGAALVNDCKYACSAKGSTLRLSLIRTTFCADTRTMARPPRPELARWQFIPYAGPWTAARLVQRAESFNKPPIACAAAHNPGGRLAESVSFLSVDQPSVVINTIKRSEDDDQIIIRCQECTGAATSPPSPPRATVRSCWTISQISTVNTLEEVQEARRGAPVTLEPFQLKSLKLQLVRER